MSRPEDPEDIEYAADGAQEQGAGEWPESERRAAAEAQPKEAGGVADQVDEEVTHLGGPEESGPQG